MSGRWRSSSSRTDALHLAAAERLAGDDVVLVAGDRDLCAAAHELGLAVVRTSL